VTNLQGDIALTRVCGVELKSSDAILVVVEKTDENVELIDIGQKKINIGDDEITHEVKSFFDAFVEFVQNNKIDIVVLKKRAKKGKMAGGAVSFKLEALIQLNGIVDTVLISGQKIAAANKKDRLQIPEELNKYQETAFMAACIYIRENV